MSLEVRFSGRFEGRADDHLALTLLGGQKSMDEKNSEQGSRKWKEGRKEERKG